MKARGFEVDEEMVRSDSLKQVSQDTYAESAYFAEVRGVQEVVPRNGMKYAVARYLEFYARTRAGEVLKKGTRPYRRRVQRLQKEE